MNGMWPLDRSVLSNIRNEGQIGLEEACWTVSLRLAIQHLQQHNR